MKLGIFMAKQDYGAQPKIHDVVVKDLKWHYSPDGQFMELGRHEFWVGASPPEYECKVQEPEKLQLNLSILQPGALKGFHSHSYQTDHWSCWEPLLVVLHDDRLDSPTFNTTMRFVLCNQTLIIPPGVWHSIKNFNATPAYLFYAVTNFFNPEDPDELRAPWDMLGAHLFEMDKG